MIADLHRITPLRVAHVRFAIGESWSIIATVRYPRIVVPPVAVPSTLILSTDCTGPDGGFVPCPKPAATS